MALRATLQVAPAFCVFVVFWGLFVVCLGVWLLCLFLLDATWLVAPS